MPATMYHVRRDDMESQLKEYGYLPQDAKKIVGYLEASGTIYFNGPTMEVKDPSANDAIAVEGLANGILGRTMGSQGSYKLKEHLDYMKRQAELKGIAGG